MRRGEINIALVFAAITLGGFLSASPALAAKKVELTFVGGDECVSIPADQKKVEIFTGGLLKAKKVKWVVVDTSRYHWKMEWKGTGDDVLNGPYEIACGSDRVHSAQAKTPGTWQYKIIVSECDGAELCTLDPEVIIRRYP